MTQSVLVTGGRGFVGMALAIGALSKGFAVRISSRQKLITPRIRLQFVQRHALFVADLPYARETLGTYDLVSFFPVESAEVLADLTQSMVGQTWRPTGNRHPDPSAPFAPDWASLLGMLINELASAPQISRGLAI